ncbi:MAG: IPExxxVDY family protein [Marinilabiliales bacterium]|nr:MAG: IPExxxVDY family protein [Marinilabiliales bacterium]
MAKKLSVDIDYFDGYQFVGIVSQLKDYTLAYHINKEVEIDLKKFNNFSISDKSGNINDFSWYYFCNNHLIAKVFMVSNKSKSSKLIPSKKEIDYFLLFKDFPDNTFANETVQLIRKIPNVMAVFSLDLNGIKDADLLIEYNELHEIEEILKPAKQNQKKYILKQ